MTLELKQSVLDRRVYNEEVNKRLRRDTILRYVPHFLSRQEVAIDVGAATGHITTVLAENSDTVFGFEAVLPVFWQYCLMQNRYLNVVPVNAAVGASFGMSEFFVDDKRLSNSSFQDLVDGQKIIVPQVRLDDFFQNYEKKVSFLKIDVEGFEIEVLMGAEGLLKEHAPALMVEIYAPYTVVPPKELFQWLWDRGYQFCYYNNPTRTQGLTQVADPEDGEKAVALYHSIHDGDFIFSTTPAPGGLSWVVRQASGR
jgi:FkbM family methyltransferase